MFLQRIGISTLVSVVMVTTAAAEDWDGFYTGVFAGYIQGNADSQRVGGGGESYVELSGSGFGALLGYNHVHEDILIGLESDITIANVGVYDTCQIAPAFDCGSYLDWYGSVRGRIGMVADDLLIYGTAGLAYGKGRTTISPAGPGVSGSADILSWGWTAGFGAEYAVAENIRLKAEYIYTDLGMDTTAIGTISDTNQYEVNPQHQALKVGVNFGF
ncbi:outer membrane protein [Maritalea sp. S77]|jgi:outer membrane immunogenic protein|uniref:outer membrane protein n=1 Tax=Maritalea sp. S77 TaxID=3415125 RepID=UPI003C799BF3